jgi:hypothetical protein
VVVKIGDQLTGLTRCPHCGVANPVFLRAWRAENARKGATEQLDANMQGYYWSLFFCTTCAMPVVASGYPVLSKIDGRGNLIGEVQTLPGEALYLFPKVTGVDQSIPERVRRYLSQAIEAVHAPDGAVMLCASAVDAMLKEKGYVDGSLYTRIEQAVSAHSLTPDMAKWAHRVRLDANDPRHADEQRPHLTEQEARQVIEFTESLAEILFILPARVSAGITAAETSKSQANSPKENKT